MFYFLILLWQEYPVEDGTDCAHNAAEYQGRNEDEYDYIGKNVSAKLRRLPEPMRIFTEKLINDVLFNAQLNNLGINSFLDTSSNNNSGNVVSRCQSVTVTDDVNPKQNDRKQSSSQQTTSTQQCSNKSIFTVSDGNGHQLASEDFNSAE